MTIYLSTDIENSTALLTRFGAQGAHALARQDAVLSECIRHFGGEILSHLGDSIQAAFEMGQPLHCALELQNRLDQQDWGEIFAQQNVEIRVRVVLGTGSQAEEMFVGDTFVGDNQLRGPVADQLNQMIALSWGGQILLTPSVLEGQMLPSEARIQDLGSYSWDQKPASLNEAGAANTVNTIKVLSLNHPNRRLQSFPPLRSQSILPQHIPQEKNLFIGRSDEINAITRLLDNPSCQILTILGPGGVGKSRLAAHVASLNAGNFRDGVFLVPLAPIQLSELLIPTIAQALGVNFFSRDDPKNQLQSFLRGKQLLLVLDNFEHLTASANMLNAVLASALKVKVLITSRERLNLDREYTYLIEGLPYPGSDDDEFVDDEFVREIENSPAGALFIQIARQAAPDFKFSPEDRLALWQICQAVQGLPLGLELAASWVRTLSVSEIAAEIRRNLDFLVSASSETPQRRHSLNAVFEYSWQMLSEEERRALRKLAVFQGGFSRQAAEKVASAYGLTLTNLVDKSMLQVSTEFTSSEFVRAEFERETQRYLLLETLRYFVEKKLDAHPAEKERVQRLYAGYFIAFLQERNHAIHQSGQPRALAEIRQELANIRAAWNWCIQHDPQALEQGLEVLFTFLDTQGRFQEGYEAFYRALAAAAQSSKPAEIRSGGAGSSAGSELLQARLQARRGWFAFRLGWLEQGHQDLTGSLQAFRQLNSSIESVGADIAFAMYHLSMIHSRRQLAGDLQTAEKLARQSLELYQQLGDPVNAAFASLALTMSIYRHTEAQLTRQMMLEALAVFESCGNRHGISRVFNILGALEAFQKHPEQARRLYRKSIELCRELKDLRGVALAMNNLSSIEGELGNINEMALLQKEAHLAASSTGDHELAAVALFNLANTCYRDLQKYDEAGKVYHELIEMCEINNDSRGLGYAHRDLGLMLAERNETRTAESHLKQALTLAFSLDDPNLAINTAAGMIRLLAAQGKYRSAYGLLIAAQRQPEYVEVNLQEELENLGQEIEKHLSPETQESGKQQAIQTQTGGIFPALRLALQQYAPELLPIL